MAGDGVGGYRDGAAAQARFSYSRGLVQLPDGRVLVADLHNRRIRALSADLQQVSTITNTDELRGLSTLALLPDGRLLIGCTNRIRVLEGFPAALLSTKSSYKPPKKKKNQKKKRALAGGTSSSGLVPKRSRSGASSSSSAAAAGVSSSDSEGGEQLGGSEVEAEPLM